jgi:hypothetical protein
MSPITITIIAAGLLAWLLTCWALIDVAGRDFGGIEKKAAWGLVAFIPFVGWLIYLVIGRPKSMPPKAGPDPS